MPAAMSKFKENYVVDKQGNPIGVVLDIADYRKPPIWFPSSSLGTGLGAKLCFAKGASISDVKDEVAKQSLHQSASPSRSLGTRM
jgi:hypothetical protein